MATVDSLEGPNGKIENVKPLSSSSTAHRLASDHTQSPSEDAEKLDDRYNDPSADLKIVSSDVVVFKVRSIYLRAASKIFDDKITSVATTSHMTLKLEDQSIERATALRSLLDFLHGRIGHLEYGNLGIFRRTILLAKKYDCQLVLTAMRSFARTLTEKSYSSYRFVLGSNLDDIQLCSRAISTAECEVWGKDDEGRDCPVEWYDYPLGELYSNDQHGTRYGECSLDPSTWDIEEIRQVPTRYLAGLLRATRVVYRKGGTWKAAAARFRKVMEPFDTDSEDNAVDEDGDEGMSS
ncbi:uncharacterized protein L199_001023 [Kwoniella botswanensis]|uniref:uncharacterized protein n=1 Tax=Kwoniella botswanensis TaxID=1268659 RepID=UPI00315DD743